MNRDRIVAAATAVLVTVLLAGTTTAAEAASVAPDRAASPTLGAVHPGQGIAPARLAPARLAPARLAQASVGVRQVSASMLTSRPRTSLTPCADAPGWLCGSVVVPVDRAHPHGRSLSIGFTVYPHTDPTSTARDAIFVADGGPGDAATASRDFRLFVFGPVTDERDLVLVDNRGTGTSGAIDCPRLQRFPAEHDAFLAAVAACGAQLGDDADRYGSGDVAMDVEAVRAALGYPQITYYGQSYGTVDVTAYATRYPKRLRAVILDAGLTVTDPAHVWGWNLGVPQALTGATTHTCGRAPACLAANPGAGGALARLASDVRRHPVDGTARDTTGVLRTVHVDEAELISIVEQGLLTLGEIPAAEAALRAGDPAPLLRLAAETPSRTGDQGDPAQSSAGDNAAAYCNDQDFVFARTDPGAVRRAKYAAALAALPRDVFAPFAKGPWTGWFFEDMCVAWPAPSRFTPAVPAGATVRGVPALVLHGDLDTSVSSRSSRGLLAIFTDATYRSVAGAAHPSVGWSACSAQLARDFVTDPAAPVALCSDPAYVGPAVPAFPATLSSAAPATSAGGDASTATERRAATVAARAVLDAWLRTFRIPDATGTTPGLRGGSFDWDFASFDDHATAVLHGVQFAAGVRVSGTSDFWYGSNTVDLDVVVTGPHGLSMTLAGSGEFGFGAPFGAFDLRGASDGRALHVSVPTN
jgi:pimeloyl-ACP methyl ester carboxylesterase